MVPGMDNLTTTELATQAAIQADKRNVDRARRYLSGKMREMRSHDIKGSYHVVVGDPAQSIMGFVQKSNIDLLIMTTHGKSGLKRAVMGSVADAVIRGSGKPVLVIHPKTSSKK